MSKPASPADAPAAPLVDQVVGRLRQQILDGSFEPGDKLPPEGQLAETYGVSRNVVREAMRTLRGEGLVDVGQGRPARVAAPEPQLITDRLQLMLRADPRQSLLHLLDVRRALETEAAALAARHHDEPHRARLASAIEALERADSIEDRVVADLRFHVELAHATTNPLFPLLTDAVLPLFSELISRVTVGDGSKRAAKAHRRVLDAIMARDPERARREMWNHLDVAEADLRGSTRP